MQGGDANLTDRDTAIVSQITPRLQTVTELANRNNFSLKWVLFSCVWEGGNVEEGGKLNYRTSPWFVIDVSPSEHLFLVYLCNCSVFYEHVFILSLYWVYAIFIGDCEINKKLSYFQLTRAFRKLPTRTMFFYFTFHQLHAIFWNKLFCPLPANSRVLLSATHIVYAIQCYATLLNNRVVWTANSRVNSLNETRLCKRVF